MKKKYNFFSVQWIVLAVFVLYATSLPAQTAITAITTSNSTASAAQSYVIGSNTYNWGMSPNSNVVNVDGFTAGGVPYTYASFINGIVKLRRVNNASVSGSFTLMWAEAVTNGTIFNMLPEYQDNMEIIFDNRVFNKGTDNFFDNSSGNSNNIERMDWIVAGGFSSTATPSQLGFAVFERGAVGAHDPFCIAPITSLDAGGNPAGYGNILRVAGASYGDPGPAVNYRIVKGAVGTPLADAGTGSQSRGGVIISLQNLGIAPNTTIYGYSLMANDLPAGAVPANLLNVNNATNFPLNTGNPGGIDLIAVTGLYVATSLLPVQFSSFTVHEKNGWPQLTWQVENETPGAYYEIERKYSGSEFLTVKQVYANAAAGGRNQYMFTDDAADLLNPVQYRIRQTDADGRFTYSPVVVIGGSKKTSVFALYPNPAVNTVFINLPASAKGPVTLQLTDLDGRLIKRKTFIGTKYILDVAALPNGLYNVQALSGGNRYEARICKQ